MKDQSCNGSPIIESNYNIGGMQEYWACLRNPHWRQVLKAWVRAGIARGVDGFIVNYFYFSNHLAFFFGACESFLAAKFHTSTRLLLAFEIFKAFETFAARAMSSTLAAPRSRGDMMASTSTSPGQKA